MKNKIALLVILVVVAIAGACKKKPQCDGSNPTYTSSIKSIIDGNCNSSGCHNSGSGNGVFTTYTGLKPYLDNGSFKRSVLEDQTMPEGSAKLSKDELNKLQCWSENGFPEN
ncbi:MAG: hypothetical protein ACKVOK_08870 [Flavobacteriales bacterium]